MGFLDLASSSSLILINRNRLPVKHSVLKDTRLGSLANGPNFLFVFSLKPNDVVLDIFAGSNTMGAVAEVEKRQWLAFELQKNYIATSVFRFLPKPMPLESV